ncbi:hypothetical protein D3C73_1223790 [compost metagenome]
MIRLIILLLGAQALHGQRRLLMLFGWLWICVGVLMLFDVLQDGRSVLALDALAVMLALEGVLGDKHLWRRFLLLVLDPNLWMLAVLRSRGESMTWTPGLVLDYARMLQQVTERQHQRWWLKLREVWRILRFGRAQPGRQKF